MLLGVITHDQLLFAMRCPDVAPVEASCQGTPLWHPIAPPVLNVMKTVGVKIEKQTKLRVSNFKTRGTETETVICLEHRSERGVKFILVGVGGYERK